MDTENRDESRPRKIIPSIGRRENTDQQGERRPYNQNYNRSEGGNYERKPYNRNDGGNRPYGNSYNRPNREGGYDNNRPYRNNNYSNREGGYNREGNYGNREGGYRDNNYGNRDNNYGNRDNNYGNRENSYGNREGGYNRPSVNRPYGNNSYGGGNYYNRPRPNYDNRPSRPYNPASQENAEGAEGSGLVKKRRPRVGDTRINSYDNAGRGMGGNRPYGNNNRQPYGAGGNNRRPVRRTGDYNPNAKYNFQKQLKYKEVLADPNEPIRLNKFLANAGVCSRREADEYIQAGVVKVNDVVITELGTKITRSDKVTFHDQPVKIEGKIYILLNKPKNCVTTSDDPQERLTVMDLVKNACQERIYPVGRLDRNTTGVLLLTNDGDLASKLTHPSFKKKKIYHVWLDKPVAIEDMEKIANGLELEDGEIHADAISYASPDDKAQVGIEIHSGRNRIVRRIFESLGYHVTKLDRVYFAGLTKKNLPRGKWRYLNEREVNALRMGAFE